MIADSNDEIVFKKCPHCGHINNGDVEVCLSCGVNIRRYVNNLEEINAHKVGGNSTKVAHLEAGWTQNHQLKKNFSTDNTAAENYLTILIVLFFLGLVIILGSITTAFFVRSRNNAATEYLERAITCVEDNDPDCAYIMIKRASKLGQKESNTEPILLWALENFITEDLNSDNFDQMIKTIRACLEIDPENPFCINTLCIDNDWVLENYQLNNDHEHILATLNDILNLCEKPDPAFYLFKGQVYLNWYQESLENQQYFKAWRIKNKLNAFIQESLLFE